MDRIIQSFLTSLGLDSDETKIYCALLENDSKTPLELSKETKIPRTTVYHILQELKEKQFLPASPKQLELLVETKTIEAQNLHAQLPSILKLLQKDKLLD